LGVERRQVGDWLRSYRDLHDRSRYSERFGELKTLSLEEAFALYVTIRHFGIANVVEIGSQAGKSTRRIVDMLRHVGVTERLACFDVVDDLEFVSREEVDFHCEDLHGRFRETVLDRNPGGLIFLDAHPHSLIHEIVCETISHPGDWILAVHDCTAGLCNPRMQIPPDAPYVTSETGIWERHILAGAAGIDDPLDTCLDDCRFADTRLRILSTRHGLALLIPERMLESRLVVVAP
jgi:hypothetical protein